VDDKFTDYDGNYVSGGAGGSHSIYNTGY